MALVQNCRSCNGCSPKLDCKCKLPCALSGPVSNVYPYFSYYPTPPVGTVSSINLTGLSTTFTIGGSANFPTVAVLPDIATGATVTALLWSPYTGGGPYTVTVTNNNDGTVNLTIPAAVVTALINQGAVFINATPEISIIQSLLLRVWQS